jgi:hypothetical protein
MPLTIAVVRQNCEQPVVNNAPLLLVLVQQPVVPVEQNEQQATPLALDEMQEIHEASLLAQLLQPVLVVVE